MAAFSFGNGWTFSQTQNLRQLTYDLKLMSGSSTVSHLRHIYDANANLTNLTNITDYLTSAATRNLGYDDLDRLSTASGLWGSGSYTYDGLGNLKTKVEGGQTMTYNYNASVNRLTSITGANPRTFSYDVYGNATNNGVQGFAYNRAGDLISSTLPSIAYKYDGHKRRVQRTEGSQTTYTMYSQSGQLLHKSVGGVATDYVYAGSLLLARKEGSTVHYVHNDLLGSPVDGKAGSTGYTENYRPWGDKIDHPIQLAGDVGYTGHQSDVATGFTYMQARYYDPVVGRFMAVDPVGFSADSPMTFNRYSYANNNPFRYNDPDGRIVNFIAKFVADVAINVAYNYVTTGEAGLGSAVAESAAGVLNPAKTLQKAAKLVDAVRNAKKVDAPNKPPNPYGSRGGPEHSGTIDRRIGELEGGGHKHLNGGSLPEEVIPTPGGCKTCRRPDITTRAPDGSIYRENVGRSTQSGNPISRETRALDDIEAATGTRPGYTPYDR